MKCIWVKIEMDWSQGSLTCKHIFQKEIPVYLKWHQIIRSTRIPCQIVTPRVLLGPVLEIPP